MSLEAPNVTPRQLEQLEVPELETIDVTKTATLAAYEAGMMSNFKQILGNSREMNNRQYLIADGPLSPESRAGLQAIGTMRVMFYHWDRALQKVKQNPHDETAVAKLRQFDTKIGDLLSIMNTAVETKFAAQTDDAAVEAPAPAEPLVLTAAERVADTPDTVEDVAATIKRLEAEIEDLETLHLYPDTIAAKKLSLERATNKLAAMSAGGVDETEPEPVVLSEPESEPEVQSVDAPVLEEGTVVEAPVRSPEAQEERRSRLQLWWSRLRPAQRGVIMGAVFAMVPTVANQYTEAFQNTAPIEATVQGIGLKAAWGSAEVPVTEPGVTKLKVTEVLDTEAPEVAKVTVMPPIPRVMEEVVEESVVGPEAVDSVSVTEAAEQSLSQADAAPEIEMTVPTVAESLPDRYVGVVKQGQLDTYPDNQLDKFFATVDTKNLPPELIDRLKAKTKTTFYADADALKAAGFSTTDANLVFDGEKINYEQPVEHFREIVSSTAELLAAPHTEVVEAESNLTDTIIQSYASDLAVVPTVDRPALVAQALQLYEASTPDAITALGIEAVDSILAGTVVDLRPLAPYLAAATAAYVREQDRLSIESESTNEETSEAEPTSPETTPTEPESVITPDTYPGGELGFSRDYQSFLASLGITGTSGSWFDAMFTPTAQDNQAVLSETVGDITKLMISETPEDRAAALRALGIAETTAKQVYDVIVAERAAGRLSASLDNDTPVEAVLRDFVLQSAATTI